MESALFFLPSALCLLFGMQFVFRKKNHSQRYLMNLLFAATFYFITYAFYISPATDYEWLCRLDSVNEPLLLCLTAMLVAYVHLYIHKEKDKGKYKKKITKQNLHWLIMPAIAFGAINMLLYYLVGFDVAAEITKTRDEQNVSATSSVILDMYSGRVQLTILKLFGLFNHTIFDFMAYIYAAILITSCVYCSCKNGYRLGDVYRFFCKNHETTCERAVSACTLMLVISISPMLILGRTYFINHPWAGLAMTMFVSVSLFFLVNVEMMSQRKKFTINTIVTSSFIEAGVSLSLEGEEKEKHEEEQHDIIAEKTSGDLLSVRTKHIVEKMHDAFENGKAYTNPELTVGAMAEMIGTNRTTLSNIVNQQYGITFRDYVNRYRIEAAKSYILEHPTATQEEIAVACGFRSASALNHKFKETEGIPPTLWLTTRKAEA